MLHSKTNSGFLLFFLCGHCGMEITVLLLLTVPLTVASPLRPTHRSDSHSNTALLDDMVQASGVKRSEVTQEEHAPALRIIPFHSEPLDVDAVKHKLAVKLRPRRTPQRGCQLGTCQLHNLANTLFIFSKTNGKDESKKASDPQGYGR
ncbi:adrenomedullin 5 [Solea senegalensis]|uniref:Adrenomedullin 5 n=1 Tax=Solea senegalensis TaxID=28829 RepID=A0AAV6RPG8_SOLSE|nr:adrenomedullin 5 [Solea senegalensis]